MFRLRFHRVTLFGLVAAFALTALLVPGCSAPLTFSSIKNLNPFYDQEKERRDNVRSALRGEDGQLRFVGDYIKIADSTLGYIKVQGIGLVNRLDGTGENPPESPYRRELLSELRIQEIEDPQTYLASSETALVIVTAYLPPIIRKGEKVDVQVQLPDGSEAKSLAGGFLMPTHMTVHELLGGQVREGHDLAISRGHVMVEALGEGDGEGRGLRRGIIPGGAIFVGDDRLLTVGIRNEYRTVRMSAQLANRIGRRFHDFDKHGIQQPLAKAQNHTILQLKVHERYRDNYPRYLQVIRNMVLSETPVEKHLRMQQLGQEIRLGPTAELAALQLEAIGTDAIPILKTGLGASSLEARFHSAVALAYLGKSDGVPELKEAAATEPAFRVFALAALATLENGSSAEALRELLSHESVETRYGAFRALSTIAPNDYAIAAVMMPEGFANYTPEAKSLDDQGRPQLPGGFTLHPVDVEGEPLIHLTRHKKAEIVVFGANQELQMPLYLRAGSHIMIQDTTQGDKVVVKRIAPDERTQVREVSPRVVDIIMAASDLGAGYPEIAQMLVQAEEQHNLAGKIAIDEMPRAGRRYERPAEDLEQDRQTLRAINVGTDGLMPTIFDAEDQKPVTDYVPPEKEKSDTEEVEEDATIGIDVDAI
ncbi:MAG: flagellar basal body P-ring protein FlgI [Planctomycetaceae bacterium]